MATAAEAPRASTASSDERPPRHIVPPHAPGQRRRHKRFPSVGAIYLAPALALYGLFLLWPIVEVVWLSFQQWDGYGPQTWIGGGNFATLFADPVFRTALAHSLLWEGFGAIVPALLGLGLALLVRQSRARIASLITLFVPVLLPATVVAALWVLVYSPLSGPLNTALRAAGLGRLAADWLGDPHLALAALFAAWLWSSIGVATLIFWSGLQTIDREYYLLARAEGAGPFWRFGHVTLPGIRRTGAIALLVNAALAAQVFDLVFVTTGGGPGYATMLLPLDMYGRAFGGHTGQGAATACVQIALGLALAGLALFLGRGDGTLQLGEASADTTPGTRGTAPATIALAAIVILLLLPIVWLLLAALEPGRDFALFGGWQLSDLRHPTGDNIATAWNAGFGTAMGTSLALALAVTAGTLVLSAPAAFALAHLIRRRLWRRLVIGVLLLGLLQPTPVLIVPLFTLLRNLDLLDTAWGVLLPEIARALPFAVLLIWAALNGGPEDVLQAAEVDGASAFQRMLHVALPLARPAMYAAAIWSFVSSWNEYLLPTVVSQDGSLQTVPTLLASFLGRYNTEYGPLAAASALALIPSVVLVLTLRLPASRGMQRAARMLR
ncbi:MAG TPA: ABC transporter permease subunit [Chloroflexota bacterium]